ncbi:LysR substrate-binding domain-containing protein [Staphylococcus arlettae]|uniref:LysR substrate-binding domain-containing protein n=1 Tax=Staphylococcus arlettae TaxID=29378 RepID=UPI00398AA64C
MKQLPKEYHIVYKSHQNFNTYIELENSITKLSNDWWNERYDTYPRNICQTDKIEICKKFVEKGMGYAIVPKSCIVEDDQFYMKDLKFKNGEDIMRNTWLFYREETMNTDIKHFIAFCKTYFDVE